MIRQFYITIKSIEPLTFMDADQFIKTIFPLSDVQNHLIGKYLSLKANYNENPIQAIFTFYERLDTEHQFWFDNYLNKEIQITNSKTIQY